MKTIRSVVTVVALGVMASGLVLPSPGLSQVRVPPTGDGNAPPPVDILSEAVSLISSMHMYEFSDSALWEAAIDGLITALNDPYAELLTPRETDVWTEQTTGNYSGIGLQITLLNERVTVTAVFAGTPADQAGILLGDEIVGVNEHDASDWSTAMAADSIRGPVGTDVLVRVNRAGFADPMSFPITRAEVHVPAVRHGTLASGMAYVSLDRVARNAASEMRAVLLGLRSVPGLVIDLRGNPGGYLDESLMLADLFLEPGDRLASMVQRVPGREANRTQSESWDDSWPTMVPELPIVVLVDRFTASGAEILAGALQDHDRAIVLGQRSFGKGVVQTVMELPHGRQLRFTTGTWQTPLGRSLHRPRDAQGRPLDDDPDSVRTVTTESGRALADKGGIIPDLEIADDTLTLIERELIADVNEKQVFLGLRLAEAGLAAATARRNAGEPPDVTDAELEELIAALEEDGASSDLLADPQVRSYLFWRARMTTAWRMGDIGAQADLRMERDPVLTEAVRLLAGADSPSVLIEAIRAGG